MWLWSGPEAEAPPCPPSAPALAYEGHTDLRSTGSCGTCACTTPECGFPERLRVSAAGPDCVDPLVDILVPPNWDGSCFTFPPIQKPISVFFQRSTRSDCVPLVPQVDKHMTFSWDTFARACAPTAALSPCSTDSGVCATHPPEGFQQCLFNEGDPETCPAGYPELRRFHGAVDDQSSCSPCACQLPEESHCRVFVTLDTQETCVGSVGTTVTPTLEGCVTNAGPSRFVSLRGEIKDTEPDVCIPQGGALVGQPLPAQPTTFCCRTPS
ncbi:PE_PGRS family protein [Chondromyces apiculatus DSM 436]|uniref:PE_PGRS family protein n=1 Tax=Chondromyces apiculatus DSM 436 TaxID=1192034 RepID=A0A017T4M0_9BACT|nr:PE_PGRS family protein [Chondromyces apiculatus DSM 436]